jgi:hypothetical protein
VGKATTRVHAMFFRSATTASGTMQVWYFLNRCTLFTAIRYLIYYQFFRKC